MIFRLLFWSTLFSISALAVLPDYSALPLVVSFSDLLNHAVAFTTLTLLYAFAYGHTIRRIGLTLLGYGVIIEIVQTFLPTRYASTEDVVVDAIGIVFGALMLKTLRKFT
ncbi:MAG: VanZ family protein [Epsilonproteobacteria bacterium]|nr:VanZ family protein [Campylobacterota bacterium]